MDIMGHPKNHFSILLASASPRRRMLLGKEGFSCSVEVADVEEETPCSRTVHDIVVENARLKGQAVLNACKNKKEYGSNHWVLIAADTLVVLENKVYGKPKSIPVAKKMLKELALKPHLVLTGVYMKRLGMEHEFSGLVQTEVVLKALNETQLRALFKKSNPLDKAAGYGFQDAPEIVEKMEGSKTNVIGLPMETILNVLKNWSCDLDS